MSAGLNERIQAWVAWRIEREGNVGMTIVGFTHHCGDATLVATFDGFDGDACRGCRFVIASPEGECEALYQPDVVAAEWRT